MTFPLGLKMSRQGTIRAKRVHARSNRYPLAFSPLNVPLMQHPLSQT